MLVAEVYDWVRNSTSTSMPYCFWRHASLDLGAMTSRSAASKTAYRAKTSATFSSSSGRSAQCKDVRSSKDSQRRDTPLQSLAGIEPFSDRHCVEPACFNKLPRLLENRDGETQRELDRSIFARP